MPFYAKYRSEKKLPLENITIDMCRELKYKKLVFSIIHYKLIMFSIYFLRNYVLLALDL